MLKLLTLLCCIFGTMALDNGVGRTPAMGWNSWNRFRCEVNETIVRQTMAQLIKTGLREKGYIYINLDDCWQVDRDPKTHEIQYDKNKFKSGLPELIADVHDRGFKFGLYSDAGQKTCQGRPGSYGYEQIDARTYAKWEVDYLKYDNCFNEGIPSKIRYTIMRNQLNATGRPIYYSMCEWGLDKPWTWARDVSNSWRTTLDIRDSWDSFILILQKQIGLSNYAMPGAWNDPDMLEVGNGGMTHDEYQSHFALWAVLKAPLLIGCDLSNITKENLQILGNEEMIAINQDELGIQADLLKRDIVFDGFREYWGGWLSQRRYVIVFFNRSLASGKFQFKLADYSQFNIYKLFLIRDVINHVDITVPLDNIISVQNIRKHACSTYVLHFHFA